MGINQDIVTGDGGVKRRDITNAPHISCQVIDLFDAPPRGDKTTVQAAQIEAFEFIGR